VKSPFPKLFICETQCHLFTIPSSFSFSYLWPFPFIFFPQNHSSCCFQNITQSPCCPVWLSDAKIFSKSVNCFPVCRNPSVYSILSVDSSQETSCCAHIPVYLILLKHARSVSQRTHNK